MMQKASFEIRKYEFNKELLPEIKDNHYVENYWPLVYILSDGNVNEAYVGETADARSRMSSHLRNEDRNSLTAVHFITSQKFNKSATLDIEANLIKYIAGDGKYNLLNANLGLANHNYYQKNEVYWDIFTEIWSTLRKEGITLQSIEDINNSDLFKYSPYKTLTAEQKQSLIVIIQSLLKPEKKSIVIQGGAGTGKTILAIYLFKLLNTELEDFSFEEFADEEAEFVELITKLKEQYLKPSMALVVPMSSFRGTLQNVFKNVKGLSSKMVVGPTDLSRNSYDIVIVDEAHRLRKRVNLGGYYGHFDKANKRLGLDKDTGTELDWVQMQSKKNILFYDANQSIKPSDVDKENFDKLKSNKKTVTEELISQFRVNAGDDYVSFVNRLLDLKLKEHETYTCPPNYELKLFDSIEALIDQIQEKNSEHGLSRLVAGFSWKWISEDDDDLRDIEIEGVKLRWNSVTKDWVNSANAAKEVGCIHTTQGYDLNYTGVIFGEEIIYNKEKGEIEIIKENYFDSNGKNTIKDPAVLKEYILNIYRTIMLRGIMGTYVYACDENLREYLKKHLPHANKIELPFRLLTDEEARLNKQAVPLYSFSAAAGSFSEAQNVSNKQWVELPDSYRVGEDHFVCKVEGESMNKRIPSGSWCLFRKDTGGSRNGKIVLVEHHSIQDDDYESGFTVKKYESQKKVTEDDWEHTIILLKPMSYDSGFEEIELSGEETNELKVVGIFAELIV